MSPLRELHNGVFDAIVGGRGGTVFVGNGSWAYNLVGRWMPRGLVMRMMGQDGSEAVGMWEGERNSSEECERVEEGGLPKQETLGEGYTMGHD